MVKYKNIFPLIRDNKIWAGNTYGSFKFNRPDENIKNIKVCWLTNLTHKKRKKFLELDKIYNKDNYYKYYNFNAINVDKVKDIPKDYEGIMGVPITFINHYNPKQFKIIGLGSSNLGKEVGIGKDLTEEEHKKFYKENIGYRRNILFYIDKDGKMKIPYERILIRKKTGNKK